VKPARRLVLVRDVLDLVRKRDALDDDEEDGRQRGQGATPPRMGPAHHPFQVFLSAVNMVTMRPAQASVRALEGHVVHHPAVEVSTDRRSAAAARPRRGRREVWEPRQRFQSRRRSRVTRLDEAVTFVGSRLRTRRGPAAVESDRQERNNRDGPESECVHALDPAAMIPQ